MKNYLFLLLTVASLPSCATQGEATLNQRITPIGVDQAYAEIRAAIESNPKLSIMAEVDHQANAARAGLQMRPSRLLIFGNPKMGTPLMKEASTIAIDLPQKILIYQNEVGQTVIVYNEAAYLAERHGIEGQEAILDKMAAALDKIAGKGVHAP